MVKAQLDRFISENGSETLSTTDYFEAFSIFCVENGLLVQNINPFSVHLKGKEFGLDGVAILVQGELCSDIDAAENLTSNGRDHSIEFHFYQAKTSEGLDYGNLSKFLDAVVGFFNGTDIADSADIRALRDVKDYLYRTVSRRNPALKCFYCVSGNASIEDVARKLVDVNKLRLEELNLFSDISVDVIGAKELQDGYRSATNAITKEIEISKTLTLPDHPSVDESYLGLISGSELVKLVSHIAPDGSAQINPLVFYDNVRDFNQDSEINKSILKSLMEGDSGAFVFRNNGVTAVAREVTRKNDRFTLVDFQIVNGCQTANIIFQAPEAAKNVQVPFRLIGSGDQDFVASIIVGTNKQNPVKDEQFLALLPFMKDLEEFCSAQSGDNILFLERRENQYREDRSVEKTRIFKVADVVKAIASMYFFQPNRAARDYRAVRDDFVGKAFSPDHNVELYHLAALASYRFDFSVRNRHLDRSRAIFKYYVLFALSVSCGAPAQPLNGSRREQEKLVKALRVQVQDQETFVEFAKSASKILESLEGVTQSKSREQLRDFIRSDTALNVFRDAIVSSKLGS